MSYVDGFVAPVKRSRIDEYKKQSEEMRKKWKAAGALEYVDCISDDAPVGQVTSFPQAVKLEDDEVIAFGWIVYKSKEDRDRINKQMMDDPMMKDSKPEDWAFDGQRMVMGGFKPVVGMS